MSSSILESLDDLTESEWAEYTHLVDWFVTEKSNRNYGRSDELRNELRKWQEQTGDQKFIEMNRTAHYRFHPYFENIQHRRARISKRGE